MKKWIADLDKGIVKGLDYVWLLCLSFLMLLVLYDVLSRFLGLFSFSWSDEMIMLALIWMVFGKGALLFRNNDHLRVDLMDMWLANRPKSRKVYKIAVSVCVLICLAAFAWVSLELVLSMQRVSPILGLSYRLWVFSMFFSMSLSSIYVFIVIIKEIRR